MSQLKVFDGTIYSITDYATPNRFEIILDNLTAAEVLAALTEENLSEIQFLTDSGAVTGVYRNQNLYGYMSEEDRLEVFIKDADLCRYGLTLDEDNRIVSAVPQRYAPENAVIVDKLPDGKYTDYRYIDGEYIHDPLPIPDPPDPQPSQEERIAQLEAALTAIEEGIASV